MRSSRGPRQSGGGRQTAGPRHQERSKRGPDRGKPPAFRRNKASTFARHPEVRAQRASKGDGPSVAVHPSRAAKARPPQDDGEGLARAVAALPTAVQTVAVMPDESGMRVDRFLEARFPGLSFSHIQRIVRKGELRVNGKLADSKDRIEEGQSIRIPPLKLDTPKVGGELSEAATKTLQALKDMIIYEDADVMVLNKPAGLAVQGGS